LASYGVLGRHRDDRRRYARRRCASIVSYDVVSLDSDPFIGVATILLSLPASYRVVYLGSCSVEPDSFVSVGTTASGRSESVLSYGITVTVLVPCGSLNRRRAQFLKYINHH
jgi:hypothetical protein